MTDQTPRPEAEEPKPALDLDTQSVLDALDDELDDAKSHDAGTQQLLQALDEIKPQTVIKPPREIVGGGADESTIDTAPPSPAAQIHYRYRVTITPPPAIQGLIRAAVSEAKLDAALVQQNMLWQADFQTNSEDAVLEIIENWHTNNLPLETALERVYADVFGAQDYVAGWRLTNEDKLQAAHHRLTMQLAPLITVEPTANTVFRTFFGISYHVPAPVFPKLVAHLQQQFDSIVWPIATCELRRQTLDDEGQPAPTAEWEVVRVFGTAN